MVVDNAVTCQTPKGEICMANPHLLPNNPARQQYHYISVSKAPFLKVCIRNILTTNTKLAMRTCFALYNFLVWISAHSVWVNPFSLNMQANLPEPYVEANLSNLVEGLPAGLSDAQVNLEISLKRRHSKLSLFCFPSCYVIKPSLNQTKA